VSDRWVPGAGDIVWMHFSPQAGHEQAGHRPAIVLSDRSYNAKRGMMICVPMTSQTKGYPFEVPIAGQSASVALADQVKSVDWRAREASHKGSVTASEMIEIRSMVAALIGIVAPA
jgi:mRNA interferase MazF